MNVTECVGSTGRLQAGKGRGKGPSPARGVATPPQPNWRERRALAEQASARAAAVEAARREESRGRASGRPIRLLLVQKDSLPPEEAAALLDRELTARPAELVLLPENFIPSGQLRPSDPSHPHHRAIGAVLARHQATGCIGTGDAVVGPGVKAKESVLLGPNGAVLACWDKKCVWGGGAFRMQPGDGMALADTPLGRLGGVVCADIEQSDTHRAVLADGGANFILNPVSIPGLGRHGYQQSGRERMFARWQASVCGFDQSQARHAQTCGAVLVRCDQADELEFGRFMVRRPAVRPSQPARAGQLVCGNALPERVCARSSRVRVWVHCNASGLVGGLAWAPLDEGAGGHSE